jgi:hypothetical protein
MTTRATAGDDRRRRQSAGDSGKSGDAPRQLLMGPDPRRAIGSRTSHG